MTFLRILLILALVSRNTLLFTFAEHPVCHVCGNGKQVGSPDNVAPDPFSDAQWTCAQYEAQGNAGNYTSTLECLAIQFAVAGSCDCVDSIVVTETPTAATSQTTTESPTDAPSVVVIATNAPTTAAPSATLVVVVTDTESPSSVEEPTSAPTMAAAAIDDIDDDEAAGSLPFVTGTVKITLHSVAGAMPTSTIAAYETQTTLFFRDFLREVSPPVFRVKAVMEKQQLFQPTLLRRTRRRRQLQSDDWELEPLETWVIVTGTCNILDDDGEEEEERMDTLLAQTVSENEEAFVSYLRNATPAINQIYFKPVESVEALDISSTAASTEAPANGGNDQASGLSGGAIAGIAIGALVGGALLYVGLMMLLSKSPESSKAVDKSHELEQEEKGSDVGDGDDMSAGEEDQRKPEESTLASRQMKPMAPVIAPVLFASTQEETKKEMDDASDPDDINESKEEEVESITTKDASGKVTKVVMAPAGKLGIVIDTTIEGPVIHQVNSVSPLKGIVKPGDIITAIDNVDTRAMSAASITALMVKTANQKRRLNVLVKES